MSMENFSTKGQVYLKDRKRQNEKKNTEPRVRYEFKHLSSLRDLLLNWMAQDQNYFIKREETLPMLRTEDMWAIPICCIWGVCSKAVTGWIDVSTGTCSLSISWQFSQGHISFQHLHVSVCQAPHRQTYWHPENEGPSTSNSLGVLLATRRSDGLLSNILTTCSEVFIFFWIWLWDSNPEHHHTRQSWRFIHWIQAAFVIFKCVHAYKLQHLDTCTPLLLK